MAAGGRRRAAAEPTPGEVCVGVGELGWVMVGGKGVGGWERSEGLGDGDLRGVGRRNCWFGGFVQDEGPPDVEVTMRPLLERPGVVGYFVTNDAGIPIKWSSTGFETKDSLSSGGGGSGGGAGTIPRKVVHFAALVSDLVVKSRDTCSKVFPKDSPEDTAVKWLRMRTNDREIIVAPGDGCTLVVIQKKAEDEAEEGEEGEEDEA